MGMGVSPLHMGCTLHPSSRSQDLKRSGLWGINKTRTEKWPGSSNKEARGAVVSVD